MPQFQFVNLNKNSPHVPCIWFSPALYQPCNSYCQRGQTNGDRWYLNVRRCWLPVPFQTCSVLQGVYGLFYLSIVFAFSPVIIFGVERYIFEIKFINRNNMLPWGITFIIIIFLSVIITGWFQCVISKKTMVFYIIPVCYNTQRIYWQIFPFWLWVINCSPISVFFRGKQ